MVPRFFTFLVLAAATVAARPGIAGDAEIAREDQLKAGYLFNFAKFIEWPANGAPDLVICFRGGNGVHASLAASVADKQIGTRKLAVRRLNEPEAVAGCSILYVDAAAAAGSFKRDIIAGAVLTVSDSKGFASHGGMIELFTENNRLRFSINVENARRAGLRISSALLQLATIVDKDAAQ